MRGPRRSTAARCSNESDGGRFDGLSAESLLDGARRAQASVAFGASYVILRRIKRVPMPRGASSEVACGRLSEVSILWTGVMRTAEASVAFGSSYALPRRI